MTINTREKFDAQLKMLTRLHRKLATVGKFSKAYCAEVAGVPEKCEDKMLKGEHKLRVKHFNGKQAILKCLEAWRHYEAEEGISTKYVKRYAGFIVCHDPDTLDVLNQINVLKTQIKACVQDAKEVITTKIIDNRPQEVTEVIHGRDSYQKHQFIHEAFPRVMTHQLYRHINVLEDEIKGLSFYWTLKSVPKRMDHLGAIEVIKKRNDYNIKLDYYQAKIADIERHIGKVFEIGRIQHAALMLSIYDGTKQRNIHCTTPVVLTNIKNNIKHNKVPPHEAQSKEKRKINPREDRILVPICGLTHINVVMNSRYQEM